MSVKVNINKGNYGMDTLERETLFAQYRGEGWENEYSAYRANWSEFPRQQYVPEYPLLVDIELSSLCNLKCPMCYTITDDFKKKVHVQLMDYSLFTKVIDEISGHVPAVRLSLRGEPTLHPNFVDCVRYCKQHGIGEVSFLTNGSKLTDDFFIAIAEAGADWITISVDGVGEQYEAIRKPLKFNETLNRLKAIQMIKKTRGWHRPVVKVQGIWPAIKNNPTAYYLTLAPYCDLVAFNPLIDYLGKDSDIVYEDDFHCPQIYQRLVIGSDGQCLLCANDEEGKNIIGDANTSSVYSIWHGKELERVRQLHRQGKFKEISSCRCCFLPRATEDSEHAQVEDRTIIIKNYVGRSQEIGR